jgi:hypothetical protein
MTLYGSYTVALMGVAIKIGLHILTVALSTLLDGLVSICLTKGGSALLLSRPSSVGAALG